MLMAAALAPEVLDPITTRVRTSAFTLREIGQAAPSRVAKKLTDNRIKDHLAGEHIIGVYPMAAGKDTTRIALLDLDSHKGETPWPDMLLDTLRIMDALEAELLCPIPFRSSGGKGIHLYILWEDEQDAYSVRQALGSVLSSVGFFNGTKGLAHREVEIFPKQDLVAPDRYGNMFVLPLAGKSIPLSVETLDDLPREAILTLDWPTSAPVRVQMQDAVRPVSAGVSLPQQDFQALQQALDAIPNDDVDPLSYEDWRNVIFAIHDATGGSDAGRDMAHNFSSKCGKHNFDFLDERVWPYVRSERGALITIKTVFNIANRYGWTEDISEQFAMLPVPSSRTPEAEQPWPKLERDKTGILSTVDNLQLGLSHPGLCGLRLAVDLFTTRLMCAQPGTDDWIPYIENDNYQLRVNLAKRGFKPITKELMRDAVRYVAFQHRFDAAQMWLGTLTWDGVPRVESFLSKYFGCEDCAYVRASSNYLWSALAGRILVPGIKADMVVVLSGSEGLQKSAGIAAMVPDVAYFTELAFTDKDAENTRKIRGKLVAELAELRGLQSRDAESILAFVTRTHEEWRPLYDEFTSQYARRLVMIGTTNEDDFLDGSRRNRRWLPMTAGRVNLNGIIEDRALLWAEARELFKKKAIMWQDAEALGKVESVKFTGQDVWEHDIARWLSETDLGRDEPRSQSPFILRDVMIGALGLHLVQANQQHQRRAGSILKKMGYIKRQMWHEGHNVKMWCDPMI